MMYMFPGVRVRVRFRVKDRFRFRVRLMVVVRFRVRFRFLKCTIKLSLAGPKFGDTFKMRGKTLEEELRLLNVLQKKSNPKKH